MSSDPAPPLEPPAAETGLAKGASLGRYVVLGLLGRGGMGEVYAAYDPELDRKIAIKLLRARGGTAEAAADGRTRLLREAQAIARLSHPNVVVVYDVGTFGDSVFIAMEFVEGHTLGYWIEAADRPWREVLDVYLAAGRGLIAAHTAGLVHRDFKPENVMITKTGQVRVMDFGLAREQGEDAPSPAQLTAIASERQAAALAETLDPDMDPDATAQLGSGGSPPPAGSGGYLRVKLTQTGAILGTPAYMSPEQFAGGSGDARTDQFSFCVALYEGLYRRRPFAGNNVVELMANVVAGTVTEPPENARVPTWIRKVLLRGMAVTPAARFPSMTALLAALTADPAARRRRALAAASSVMLLAAVAVGANRFNAGDRAICGGGGARAATAWGPERRAAVERAFASSGHKHAAQALAGASELLDRYLQRWTGMYRETCEATHLRGEQSAEVLDLRMGCLGERLSGARALTDVLAKADRDVVDNAVAAVGALPALDRCADVAMLRAVIKPPEDPARRAKVAALREEVARVNALSASGLCERGAVLARETAKAARALGYAPLTAEALFALGRLGESCTDPAAAIAELEEAFFAAEAARHDEVAILASTYLSGFQTDRVPDPRLSRHWIRHGEAILARSPGHPVLEAWMANQKAIVSTGEGRFEEALIQHRRALALKEKALGSFHVDTAISTLNIANTLHELGRDAEAATYIARSLEVFGKLHGTDSTQFALALANHSEILTVLRRFEESAAAIERALAIWKEREAESFYVGYALLGRGRLQLAQGQHEAARASLEAAEPLLRSHPGLSADLNIALAQTLWAFPRERPRALALARKVKEALPAEGAGARKRAELHAWLEAHRSI